MMRFSTYRLLFISIFISMVSTLHAQNKEHEGYLFVRNNPDGLVELKWITNKVLYADGYNLYKDEGSGWVKLNEQPFNKPASLSDEAKAASEEAEAIFAMVDQEESFEAFQEGMARLFFLIQCVKNNAFARAVGLAYLDENVSQGQNYKYRLTANYKGEEIEIADTSITVGPYVEAAPPQEVEIDRKKRKVEIKWKIDKLAYYAVNVYRTNLATNDTELLTPAGVVANEEDLVHEGKKHPNYTDGTIDKDTDYSYELKVIDYFGEFGKGTGALPAAAKDFDPPMDPFNLKFDQETLKVQLTWMSVIDDDRYGFNLYRYKDTISERIKVNETLIPKDTNEYWDELTEPGEWFYVVSAIDLVGNEAFSLPIIATVRDVIPPVAPSNLTTRADSGEVLLTWTPSPDNDLMGYVIYKVIEGEEFHPEHYTLINDIPTKETQYTEKLHKNVKTAFRYVVEAVDTSYNRSEYSDFSVAQLPDHLPPATPFIRSVKLEEDVILIEWEKNADDDIYGYNLFRSEGYDTTAEKIQLNLAPFLPSETSYEDEELVEGQRYVYYLNALDSARNISEFSNGFSIQIPGKDISADIKLKSFNAKMKGAKTVDIKWKVNDPEHVVGFVLFRQEGDNNLLPLTGTITEGKYRDKGLKPGTTYQYQVRMYASDGGVVKSDFKEFKTPEPDEN